MAYKNIHKRVKRLESLELIEPVKMEDTSHGAKFYRISEAGMFRLIFQHALLDLGFMVYLPQILEIHGNFSIFVTFLYPYLKKETIMAIKLRYAPPESEDEFLPVDLVEGGINFEIIESIFECCSQTFFLLAVPKWQKREEEMTRLRSLLGPSMNLRNVYLD